MPVEIQGETYLTSKEVTALLNIRRETLSRYVRNGKLQSYKRGYEKIAYFKEVDIAKIQRERDSITPRDSGSS